MDYRASESNIVNLIYLLILKYKHYVYVLALLVEGIGYGDRIVEDISISHKCNQRIK